MTTKSKDYVCWHKQTKPLHKFRGLTCASKVSNRQISGAHIQSNLFTKTLLRWVGGGPGEQTLLHNTRLLVIFNSQDEMGEVEDIDNKGTEHHDSLSAIPA